MDKEKPYQPSKEEIKKAEEMMIDEEQDGRGQESKRRTPGIEKIIAPQDGGYVIIRKDGAKLFYMPSQKRIGPAGWQWDTCMNRAEKFQDGIIPEDCRYEEPAISEETIEEK